MRHLPAERWWALYCCFLMWPTQFPIFLHWPSWNYFLFKYSSKTHTKKVYLWPKANFNLSFSYFSCCSVVVINSEDSVFKRFFCSLLELDVLIGFGKCDGLSVLIIYLRKKTNLKNNLKAGKLGTKVYAIILTRWFNVWRVQIFICSNWRTSSNRTGICRCNGRYGRTPVGWCFAQCTFCCFLYLLKFFYKLSTENKKTKKKSVSFKNWKTVLSTFPSSVSDANPSP